MDTFDFCVIIFLLVLLLLVVGLYACLLRFKLSTYKQKLEALKKDADNLDLQIEALKLLINKYKASFPPTVRDDVDWECQHAAEKSWFASNKQEAFSFSLNEKRWNALREWVSRNF